MRGVFIEWSVNDCERLSWCWTTFRIQHVELRVGMTNKKLGENTFALCLWMSSVIGKGKEAFLEKNHHLHVDSMHQNILE